MKADARLTKREAEIAELLAWGATKKEIANNLFISVRTVENISRSIYQKTELTTVNSLSAWWFCTHYHISFNLSPLAKHAIVVVMLVLVVSKEISTQRDVYRTGRRGTTSRTTRGGRRLGSEDFIWN